MGIEKRTTTIGGHTYSLTLFGAKQGQRVLLRLAKLLGPAATGLAPVVADLMTGGDGEHSAIVATGEAIRAALAGASEQDLEFLTDSFAQCCGVVMTLTTAAGPRQTDPVPLATMYDDHFAQRYIDLASWLFWCIQENYADFFGDKGIGQFLKKKGKPPAPEGSSSGSPPA